DSLTNSIARPPYEVEGLVWRDERCDEGGLRFTVNKSLGRFLPLQCIPLGSPFRERSNEGLVEVSYLNAPVDGGYSIFEFIRDFRGKGGCQTRSTLAWAPKNCFSTLAVTREVCGSASSDATQVIDPTENTAPPPSGS